MKNVTKLGAAVVLSTLFASAPAFADWHHKGGASTNAHGSATTATTGPSAGSNPGSRPMASDHSREAYGATKHRAGYSTITGPASGSNPGARPMNSSNFAYFYPQR